MKEAVHIQSEEARERTINRFCKLIATSALPSVCIYLYLQIHVLAIANGIIALLFLFFVYLNKKKYFKFSRTAIILTTNIGVLFFSFYLGYESGIYLYLFIAPLLIYLLFDFNEKKYIFSFLFLYLLTFLLIYSIQKTPFTISDKLSPASIKFIYSFNFCSAFVLCFGLITHFANNNDKYISNLIKHQQVLEEEVTLRNLSEDLLRKSLNERSVLLSEVHHRVKNNLAIISALINMQIGNLKDEKDKDIFEETKNRIYAMALIHNLLYQSRSFDKIDFVQYVDKFCFNISKSYHSDKEIVIEQQVERVEIDLNTATPLALIFNELITNAIKHAFKDRDQGQITIGLKTIENNFYQFWVNDNGVGIDEKALDSSTMGMEIIKSLVDQIDGKMEYTNNNGSHFTITIPIIS